MKIIVVVEHPADPNPLRPLRCVGYGLTARTRVVFLDALRQIHQPWAEGPDGAADFDAVREQLDRLCEGR